nr:CelD-like protein [Sphingobium sp.]
MDMAAHPSLSAPSAARLNGQGAWQELARNVAEPNAFYAPELLIAALDHLADDRHVRVIEVKERDQVIGLLPVVLSPRHGRLPIGCVANWM